MHGFTGCPAGLQPTVLTGQGLGNLAALVVLVSTQGSIFNTEDVLIL